MAADVQVPPARHEKYQKHIQKKPKEITDLKNTMHAFQRLLNVIKAFK